jgi:hypothetical protein
MSSKHSPLTRSPLGTRSRTRAPALRLLHGQGLAHPTHPESLDGHDACSPELRVIDGPARVLDGPARVLIAGSDAGQRTALLDELTQTLPASTVFAEADAICGALEHAPRSRMAIITGDVDDAPAEALMHMLTHRHPALAVLIVDSPARTPGGDLAARNDELRIQHA